MKTKRLSRITVKDADKGEVEAVFSTLDVIDADGDVTLKGAFEDGAAVVVSAYGHKSWDGALPVGKGTIRETDTEAILDAQFFMDTEGGRETFTVVKELGELQEWSYSLHDVESERGQKDGQTVNFLKKVRVKEASPVLMGAGVATRTLAAKGAKAWAEMDGSFEATQEDLRTAIEGDLVPDDLGDDEYAYVSIQGTFTDRVVATLRRSGEDAVTYQYSWSRSEAGEIALADRAEVDLTVAVTEKDARFADHTARVLCGVKAYTDRAAALAALRTKEGRGISEANRERLKGFASALREAADGLDELTPVSHEEPELSDEVGREFARFVALTHGG